MNTKTPLDPERFTDLLDIHGPRLEHWPELERNEANALLSTSSEARAALERARQLALMLDTVETPEPSAHLRARVREIPIRHPRETAVSWWPFATFTRPLLGLAAAAALGVVGGVVVPQASDALPDDQTQSADWEEWSELALGAHLDLEQW